MKASKTAIDNAVQAFQILCGATITPLHCELLISLVTQAQEAEDEAEAQHAATAPVVVPPAPGYDSASVAFTQPCCGHPDLCERPCFHRPAQDAPPAVDECGLMWIDLEELEIYENLIDWENVEMCATMDKTPPDSWGPWTDWIDWDGKDYPAHPDVQIEVSEGKMRGRLRKLSLILRRVQK